MASTYPLSPIHTSERNSPPYDNEPKQDTTISQEERTNLLQHVSQHEKISSPDAADSAALDPHLTPDFYDSSDTDDEGVEPCALAKLESSCPSMTSQVLKSHSQIQIPGIG
jgi:hypothetical protein